MQKIKIQFNNSLTAAAAAQVEEAIRKDAGVVNVKVNAETKKGVVMYDTDVTSEKDILRAIEMVGPFEPRFVTAPDEMTVVATHTFPVKQSIYQKYTAKQLFLFGILGPAVLGMLIGGGVLLASSFSGESGTSDGGQHLRGNKNAQVKLVEYSDFECPFCKRHHPTLKQILAEYGDTVSLEYKHFPLNFHPNAQKAAEASECAAEQGKFWEFHDAVFEDQLALGIPQYKEWVAKAGLNTRQFNNCLDSGKYAAKVQSEYQEGQTKGVQGTPATFINGQLVSGAQPYEAIKQAIDQALQSN